MAIMRRPATIDLVSPSRHADTAPASIHRVVAATLHHPGLQTRFFRHHGLVPWRIEHQFHLCPQYRRHQLDLVAHVLYEHLTHATARSGESHLDLDRACG